MKWYLALWKDYRSIFVFILLMCVFRSAIADWNLVPSGSMKPTIVEGDYIFVDKMAYDLRLPFTHLSLLKLSDPSRGDVVVFDSQVVGKKLVKRVVGTPGDVVALRNNVLFVNNQQASYKRLHVSANHVDKVESLLGLDRVVRVDKSGSLLSSFAKVTVPEGYYLVMGDNRDNSSDSRVIGFVPRAEIVGRSKHVVASFNADNYFLPRSDRFLHAL